MKLRTGLKVQLTEPAVIVSTIKGYPDDCAEIEITYTNKYGEEHKTKVLVPQSALISVRKK